MARIGNLARLSRRWRQWIEPWQQCREYTTTAHLYNGKSEPRDSHLKFTDLVSTTGPKKILITGVSGQLGGGLATTLGLITAIRQLLFLARKIYGEHMVIKTDIVKPRKEKKFENTVGPVLYENIKLPELKIKKKSWNAKRKGQSCNEPECMNTHCMLAEHFYYLDILNQSAVSQMVVDHNIDTIIHFSALLSAVGEANVPLALKVNVEGVQNILEVAKRYKTQIFIPSSIGAFGPTTPLDHTPDLCIQRPRTIYGVTKVYAELLGEYYNERFGVDFRSLRFPGIISATQPGGGTTDYAVQIFYDALTYGKHKCYLRPDSRLPMMYDTDCTASIIFYLTAPAEKLTRRTYNVTSYSFTPEEIATAIRRVLPNFQIDYEVCPIRQKIADSWPKSLDDTCAKRDWGWQPFYDLEATVNVMLELVRCQLVLEGKTV
uniref:L-threonine 3-dehydrogenase, mitochondrial n=1 Tax=Setaria digitata TaxID=48799 RepID=A0A915PIW1_9BILA